MLLSVQSLPLVTNPVSIFFIVLVIILFAPILLNRLKIPHIIGMIVAGIVVGPYGFNILDKDSSFNIFGQVGLLYLMFLAGLEIDMYHLKLNLKRGLVFGVMTFVIPMVIGVLASVYILHIDWLTAFLLAAMYASHTLIGYPVAARYGVTKSPSVLISIVGTIFAVIASLLVLAGAVNIHNKGTIDPAQFLLLLSKLAAYCAGILIIYPKLTRFFFKRYSDKVTQYVFILALVFMSALLSKLIGMEEVLGAFFAGLVLNRYVPSSSPLMGRIEFVGNALFIPYFLIGVGMMINVRVVGQSSTLTIAAIMLAVALAGKWLPAWAAQKIFKMPGSARRMMFGLTTAHTAVALAVVTIGYNMTDSHGNRLIDETILNGTILVILFTCAIAPIVTAGAAARIKISMLEDGETDRADEDRHQSENILIPVANPLTAGSLVEMAMLMRSRNRSKGDNLYALHVRGDNSRSSKAVGRNSLEIAQKAAASTDTQLIPIERFDLNTVTGIVNTIEERDITGVVLGMHRKSNVVDTFLGTKIEQLQRLTNRMLIISRCYIPLNTVRRIIVYVPSQAEYETGFPRWVKTIASLSAELGCRIIFYSEAKTELLLRGVIYRAGIQTRAEYKVIDSQDDFILIAGEVTDDDLFVTVCARANSVSYSATMAEMPNFLQRYFANNNLLIVFPEQFGENAHIESFIDPHLSDLSGTPPALWSRLTTRLKKLRPLRKKKNESKQYN